jgi:hypothetical protein
MAIKEVGTCVGEGVQNRCISIQMYLCKHLYINICILYIYKHINICIHIYIYIHTYILIYVLLHIYILIYIYVYIYINT